MYMAAAAAGASTPFNFCRHGSHAEYDAVFSGSWMARRPSAAPHGGGASGSGSGSGFGAASYVAPTFGAAFRQQHLDLLDYLSDDQGVPAPPPAAVPSASYVTPAPAMAPAEPVVPDAVAAAGGYPRSVAVAAAAVAGEGSDRTTTDKIAFRTRSDDEILDDGYKWRKYGKKSVKNSPNPRNYYRCSTEGCNVKKRVERDKNDPRYVVTMYEGIHNHVCPGTVYYAAQDAASGRFFVAGISHPDLN
uniref:WRKY domain-containing protein n=1 Tax=Oryza meridionalis TaxID=40149 RepID=A0A0E0C6Z6_9ORYZ